MSVKGSNRRPAQVPDNVIARNWARAFGMSADEIEAACRRGEQNCHVCRNTRCVDNMTERPKNQQRKLK